MANWMPEVNEKLMRSAVGRRTTAPPMQQVAKEPPVVAEKSQAAMLWPINRWKYPLGREENPQMREALARQLNGGS
jgi:hypothetical protein